MNGVVVSNVAPDTAFDLVFGDAGPSLIVSLLQNGTTCELDAETDSITLNYVGPDHVTRTVALTITNAEQGQVARAWSSGDLPVAGTYVAQVVVARSGDDEFPQTFPNDGSKIYVAVAASLGSGITPGPPVIGAAYYPLAQQEADPQPPLVTNYLYMGPTGPQLKAGSLSLSLMLGCAVTYTATGSEGTDFMVAIGQTLPSSTYAVIAQLAGGTSGDGTQASGVQPIDLPLASRTTTQFRVVLATPLAAGDVIQFIIVALGV